MNFAKFNPAFQQTGKNWGSTRGEIFARLLSAPKARECVAKRGAELFEHFPFKKGSSFVQ